MFNLEVEQNVPLAPFTTWKIGGPAKFFVAVKTIKELEKALAFAKSQKLKVFVLGGGSNILVSDSGFSGLVVKIELNDLEIDKTKVRVQAGVPMGRLAASCMQHNLAGLEWAVGIPGTVGGAVFGNSNCFGGSTGQRLQAALLLTPAGKLKQVTKDYFNFSYDYSILQETGEIVLEVIFELDQVSPKQMAERREKILETAACRFRTQPLGEKCAGSVFKALSQKPELIQKLSQKRIDWEQGLRDGFISAGFIIDKGLGLKGYRLEKMKISDKHANFFINLGGASAANAKKLIDFVKKECKNKLDIILEEEIKYVGF